MDAVTERQAKTLALPATGTVQMAGFKISRARIVALALAWTGTPTGVISLLVSNDSTDGVNGTWFPYAVTVPAQPAGGASGTAFEITSGFYFVAIKYVATSGTGTLTAMCYGKG